MAQRGSRAKQCGTLGSFRRLLGQMIKELDQALPEGSVVIEGELIVPAQDSRKARERWRVVQQDLTEADSAGT